MMEKIYKNKNADLCTDFDKNSFNFELEMYEN